MGQMVARSGLSEYTLRYYEKIGLIEPIARDGHSGHRRYSAQTAQKVEALACLRALGFSLEDLRRYVHLWERGAQAATEQKALYVAHAEKTAEQIRHLCIRQRYLNSKVAYWQAQITGDRALAEQMARECQQIAKELR